MSDMQKDQSGRCYCVRIPGNTNVVASEPIERFFAHSYYLMPRPPAPARDRLGLPTVLPFASFVPVGAVVFDHKDQLVSVKNVINSQREGHVVAFDAETGHMDVVVLLAISQNHRENAEQIALQLGGPRGDLRRADTRRAPCPMVANPGFGRQCRHDPTLRAGTDT